MRRNRPDLPDEPAQPVDDQRAPNTPIYGQEIQHAFVDEHDDTPPFPQPHLRRSVPELFDNGAPDVDAHRVLNGDLLVIEVNHGDLAPSAAEYAEWVVDRYAAIGVAVVPFVAIPGVNVRLVRPTPETCPQCGATLEPE